jgi:hypothetical protein
MQRLICDPEIPHEFKCRKCHDYVVQWVLVQLESNWERKTVAEREADVLQQMRNVLPRFGGNPQLWKRPQFGARTCECGADLARTAVMCPTCFAGYILSDWVAFFYFSNLFMSSQDSMSVLLVCHGLCEKQITFDLTFFFVQRLSYCVVFLFDGQDLFVLMLRTQAPTCSSSCGSFCFVNAVYFLDS